MNWRWPLGFALGAGLLAWLITGDSEDDSMPTTGQIIATPTWNAATAAETRGLWETMVATPEATAAAVRAAARAIANRARYEAVGREFGAPWVFVALAHIMESGAKFDAHLAEGSPLTARPRNFTSGAPLPHEPPYTWEESARWTFGQQGIARWRDWSIPGLLWRLEAWNGFGYRRMGFPSHYLWGRTNHERPGRYTGDHEWTPTATAKQTGAAVHLAEIIRQGGWREAAPAVA